MKTPTTVNWNLKAALVSKFGSQIRAATELGLRENRLSYLVRGHIAPSKSDKQALIRALGRDRVREILGGTHAK